MGTDLLTAIDNIFFLSRVNAVAEKFGVNVVNARSADEVEKLAASRPFVIFVLDLESKNTRSLDMVTSIRKSQWNARAKLVGFLGHEETDLMKEALTRGYDIVVPRGALVKTVTDLLQENAARNENPRVFPTGTSGRTNVPTPKVAP